MRQSEHSTMRQQFFRRSLDGAAIVAEGVLFAQYKGHNVFLDDRGNLTHARSGYRLKIDPAKGAVHVEQYVADNMDKIIARMKRMPRLNWRRPWPTPKLGGSNT